LVGALGVVAALVAQRHNRRYTGGAQAGALAGEVMDERKYQLLHHLLVTAARECRTVPEQVVAGPAGTGLDNHGPEFSELLKAVADLEHREDRPLLSVLAVDRENYPPPSDPLPRDEFFGHAEQLGLYTDPDSEPERQQARRAFAQEEAQRAYAVWALRQPPPSPTPARQGGGPRGGGERKHWWEWLLPWRW
jgi:hypothetical protein